MKKVITGCFLLVSFSTFAESFNGETKLPQLIATESELMIQVSEDYEYDNTESELVSSIMERHQDQQNIVLQKN